MMNGQQMRPGYPPYGPGQLMQPPPQQQPTPGQEDSYSTATGEDSSVPSDAQTPHPQQQYMPGYPPGAYPGYYGGVAAAAMMQHHQRPGFHPQPQMQVMPGGGYQRMYPGMMQPMRGPPGPYGYGPGGAVPYPAGGYPGPNGEEGHKVQRKNSKGNASGYKNKQRNNFQGRGSGNGNGGRGFQGGYSEGRQSEDGSPTNHEGEGSESQPEEAEKVEAPVADAAA